MFGFYFREHKMSALEPICIAVWYLWVLHYYEWMNVAVAEPYAFLGKFAITGQNIRLYNENRQIYVSEILTTF